MHLRRLIVFGVLVAAGAIAVALGAPHSPAALGAAARHAGPLAPFAFVAAWTVLTVALFPGTVLAGAGGLLFGAAGGTVLSIAGGTLGGLAAFAIARRGARGSVEALGGERVAALSARLERRGLAAVLVARAAPGVPATLLHYAAGVSRVRPWHFAVGIALGSAPRMFAYAALGGSLHDLGSPLGLAAIGMLALMTVGGGLAAWRMRRLAA
jgi:uncharacterized membrane protein YdjX (TVP38/TMEM64 family)